jgi:hypothetical protein
MSVLICWAKVERLSLLLWLQLLNDMKTDRLFTHPLPD